LLSIDKARFSISLPVDIIIKMDISREKNKTSRTNWIEQAITEKLEKEKEILSKISIEQQLRSELDELRKLVMNKRDRD
jgi:metal-responsive CopG/Arc/MetJ family transcriptional regulator